MASLTENTLKIMESTTRTTVPASNSGSKTNINRKSARKEEDLTRYEQMVIMKKNPYLDLKELEQKLYNPGWKRVRASVAAAGDVGICEEGGPYVEVVNRGLSGFAIPTKLMKAPEPKAPPSSGATAGPAPPAPGGGGAADDDAKMTEHEHKLLTNLVKDIMKFEDSKILAK